jgi:hypothetical protein
MSEDCVRRYITIRYWGLLTKEQRELIDRIGIVKEEGWVEPKTILKEYLQDKILDFGPLSDGELSVGARIDRRAWEKLFEELSDRGLF